MFMRHTQQIDKMLDELEQFGKANDRIEQDRNHKMLNLERETARLIELLIVNGRRKRILEIGTSNGFSAIWLASTLQFDGSDTPLITIERDPQKAEQATRNIDKVGLSRFVQVLVGDATQIVASLKGPFDCVFFDADRISAPDQLRILLPKLQSDALLLADNVLSHPEEIAGYIAAIEALPDFASLTIPVGKGLSVAYRNQR
jgi:predicted O-methyltransferase YrrM